MVFALVRASLSRDNPYIRYLDPLASGSEGEHVAHATLVHAHPKTLEALVDVSYLLARARTQAPQGDIGERYNRHVRLFRLAPVSQIAWEAARCYKSLWTDENEESINTITAYYHNFNGFGA